VPVPDGEYGITFKLYAQPSGGSPFWSETQKVATRDGLFSVPLGSVTSITTGDGRPGTEAAYLGMVVAGSEEMTPRLRIAGGYAIPNDKVVTNDDKDGETDADDAWVRSSPADSVLYTIRRLGIARGGCSNVLYGNWTCSMTNLGSACTTGISGTPGLPLGNMAVLGGYGNRTWAPYTSVGGGRNNKAGNEATDTSAIVVGGYGNKANAKFSYIAGGQNNTADGASASIGGGGSNSASGSYSMVGGGLNNKACSSHTTVAGGDSNTASNYYAAVGGGLQNAASGNSSTVGGGFYDSALTHYSTVGGGYHNTASTNRWSTVGGGYYNSATGEDAVVAGGEANVASGYDATIAGGGHCNATLSYATVGGGSNNNATGSCATVGGGYYNTASGSYATVPGGASNTASGNCGFAANYQSSDGGYASAAAFGGQTATTTSQVRCANLSVTGTKNFTIDHPLDPSGRILNHYCIESPEVVNLYRGVVVLGADGRAVVQLPDYFSAVNVNPMIQVSAVGTNDVFIAREVAENTFVIGGKPGIKVFWTVTADRNDQSARIGQLLTPVEQPKTGALVGRSLDDDYLASCMQQLEQMGKAGEFSFRTAAGKQRYENMLKTLREAGQHQSKQVAEPKPAQPAAQPDKLQQQ